MKKIFLTFLIVVFFQICTFASYTDVPDAHWAAEVIGEATDCGVILGRPDGSFGVGETVRRSEFATMLVRMMKWEQSLSNDSKFVDVKKEDWYFTAANTLFERGVFQESYFRPNENITRCEMATMLVSALGYQELAEAQETCSFQDVLGQKGYVSLAHAFGIINGKSDTIFDPNGYALREEAAAMMMRLYRKFFMPLLEVNGFYAISSWSQRDIAAQFDTISFGWGRLQTKEGRVWLNSSSDAGNDWHIPDGSEEALSYFRKAGARIHFAVTMTDSDDCRAILLSPSNRTDAINQILTVSSAYDGVTIDFEGMKGDELKEGFNLFLEELRARIGDKSIFVAVHPILKNSPEYFDAYDYRKIGALADAVILMAHDYAAQAFPKELLNTEYIWTPVTPFDEIFAALKAITDPEEGVADLNKIQLQISPASTIVWKSENRRIIDVVPVYPSMETVLKRLKQEDTEITYSETYKNPYAWYETESGQEYLLWYEDSRSVNDKIQLARMFGINTISLWRVGLIPNDAYAHMNIWEVILSQKQPR